MPVSVDAPPSMKIRTVTTPLIFAAAMMAVPTLVRSEETPDAKTPAAAKPAAAQPEKTMPETPANQKAYPRWKIAALFSDLHHHMYTLFVH